MRAICERWHPSERSRAGIVDTSMHENDPKEFLKSLSLLGRISDAQDIADAMLHLTEAGKVTGAVLHVDGGAHVGKW